MSDWLDGVRGDRDAAIAEIERRKSLQKETFEYLDARVRDILGDAIVFLNEQPGLVDKYRFRPHVSNYSMWVIAQPDTASVFELRVIFSTSAGLEDDLELIADTRSGERDSRIRVSDFSDDWLKTQVLKSIRYRATLLS